MQKTIFFLNLIYFISKSIACDHDDFSDQPSIIKDKKIYSPLDPLPNLPRKPLIKPSPIADFFAEKLCLSSGFFGTAWIYSNFSESLKRTNWRKNYKVACALGLSATLSMLSFTEFMNRKKPYPSNTPYSP